MANRLWIEIVFGNQNSRTLCILVDVSFISFVIWTHLDISSTTWLICTDTDQRLMLTSLQTDNNLLEKKNLWWLLGGEVTVMVLGTSRLSADYLRHSVLLWQLMRLHGGTSHELPGNCSQLSWGMLRNGDPNTQVGHINIRTSTLPSAQALLTSSLKSSVEPVCNCTASG